MPDDQEVKRRLATEAVVASAATRRVVVAGPGTGKTSLFKFAFRKEAAEGSEPRGLALTFIRALKADMEREVATALPKVKVFTFDGYCLHLMNLLVSEFGDAPEPYDLLPDLLAEDIGHLISKGVSGCAVSRTFIEVDDSDGLLSKAVRLSEYYRPGSIEGCGHKGWAVPN